MPSRDLLAAALDDRYRIDRELGRGGFATVYLAHDLRHDRPVALKVLHEEVAMSLGQERFEREIKLAARLQHPHVLGVFDSGETDGRLWFAMPFIAGESLRDKLNRERQLPVADAIGIAREILDALAYAHEQGVVHRDIKPENILLSGRHAMVADFGIARALTAGEGSLTGTGMALGTPGYMSPEQASGERTLDARTDIYATACVLYEMIAGEPPFTGPSASAIIARTLTETPRPLAGQRAGISEQLDGVIARALAKVAADRPATADAFGDALGAAFAPSTGAQAAFGPSASNTGSAGAAPALPRPGARRRTNLAAVFALGLLLGVGALFAWRSSRVDAAGRGVAVIPFENLGDATDAYFADGITEEVRGKLTSVPGLRVTARTSSNAYRGGDKSPGEIGAELGVDLILTGTVRFEQEPSGQRRVRVTPELIYTANGATKWSESFDEEMSGAFKVQSAIAQRVTDKLGLALAAEVQARLAERPTSSGEAYQEYLLGEKETESLARNDGQSERAGLAHYERAVALDTTFGLGWARVSLIYTDFFSTNQTEDLARRAEEAVVKALRYAPDNAQVRRAHIRFLRLVKKDYASAAARTDTALLRDPNDVDVLNVASSTYALGARWEEAVSVARRAAQLDPRNTNALMAAARILHGLHRYPEADEYYARASELSPANIAIAYSRAVNYVGWRGDVAAAKAVVAEVLRAGADSSELAAHFALYQEFMWVLDEPLLRRITTLGPERFLNNRSQWALKLGRTWLLLGDTARGRQYGDSSRLAMVSQLAAFPNDAQLHEMHGRALALIGREGEAIREAGTSLQMRETAVDATTGPYIRYQVARIYVQAGAYDKALDIIEPLLSTPYGEITPAWLAVEPTFRPLRSHPRFRRIVAAR